MTENTIIPFLISKEDLIKLYSDIFNIKEQIVNYSNNLRFLGLVETLEAKEAAYSAICQYVSKGAESNIAIQDLLPLLDG